jgi:hypothetical protein
MTRSDRARKKRQQQYHMTAQAKRRELATADAEQERKNQKKGPSFIIGCMERAGYGWDNIKRKYVVVRPMTDEERQRVSEAMR